MEPTAGSQLLHYRLSAKVGVGGMGEVWRAADTTLGRDVAIKFLPAAVAEGAERLSRFEREAKVLASLNHPNIATVHGFHDEGGVRFLAMELVPGEDLAERVKRGPLPLAEATEIARQIAEALEAAHDQGVVHRDLKPANIKLTPDGRVKVLDFGLAKAVDGGGSSHDAGMSPTITSLGTVVGVIIGTAAYMSPEQARGKPVDKRADVWAFGCVLFEMISGVRPFDGETVSDTLAAVLARDPDWSVLPAGVPPRLRELIGRCLEKDARRRLRDIGDARIELENILASRSASGQLRVPAEPAAPASPTLPARRSPVAAAMTVIAVLATAVAAWALLRPATAVAPKRLARLRVERPAGENNTGPGSFALAPDGDAVVFVVTGGTEVTRLWLRELGGVTGHDRPGTEGALFPFWSPDSRHIGFFADGKLKRVPRAGGAVQTVCEASNGRGGAWSPTGVIVFAPAPFGGLSKVVADGAPSVPLTTLDKAKGQTSHRFPAFLPDGRTFVYAVQPALEPNLVQNEIASLDDPIGRPLLLARNAARYAPPGYMLFPRDQALVAQKIDLAAGTMTGEIVQLAERAAVVERVISTPAISTTADGTLAYDEPDHRATAGVWYSRDGRPIENAFRHAGRIFANDMTTRGDRVLLTSLTETGSSSTILNLSDGTESRVIREDRLPRGMSWSPADGRLIASVFVGGKNPAVISIDPSGGNETNVLALQNRWVTTTSVGPDRTIVFDDPFGHGTDIIYLPGGAAETKPYLSGPANESGGVLSPDGKLIAYTSDTSGRNEVYVDSFPEHSEARRASTDGATALTLHWRGDGRELYFASADGRTLMANDVTPGAALSVGKAHRLFDLPAEAFGTMPSPQGDRFLVLVPVGEPRNFLTLVQNWSAQLR